MQIGSSVQGVYNSPCAHEVHTEGLFSFSQAWNSASFRWLAERVLDQMNAEPATDDSESRSSYASQRRPPFTSVTEQQTVDRKLQSEGKELFFQQPLPSVTVLPALRLPQAIHMDPTPVVRLATTDRLSAQFERARQLKSCAERYSRFPHASNINHLLYAMARSAVNSTIIHNSATYFKLTALLEKCTVAATAEEQPLLRETRAYIDRTYQSTGNDLQRIWPCDLLSTGCCCVGSKRRSEEVLELSKLRLPFTVSLASSMSGSGSTTTASVCAFRIAYDYVQPVRVTLLADSSRKESEQFTSQQLLAMRQSNSTFIFDQFNTHCNPEVVSESQPDQLLARQDTASVRYLKAQSTVPANSKLFQAMLGDADRVDGVVAIRFCKLCLPSRSYHSNRGTRVVQDQIA